MLNIVAVSATGGTAHAKRTILFDFVPGTLIFDVTDPNSDDNGPGNYAYPTSADFKPGAFDIQGFQVYDAGSNVIFRLKTRDLSETFGSPLGAQLVDIYVHVPGAVTTSTAAANASRNFTIAAPFAWSRLIQAQGFGQRYVDASRRDARDGRDHGERRVTLHHDHRPEGVARDAGPGWGFTVVLTGQDGFSSDQARGFQPTPQPFQFGVCATASADPHCTFPPGSVPKAVDVITAVRSGAVDRARLHARSRRAVGRLDPVAIGSVGRRCRASAGRRVSASEPGRTIAPMESDPVRPGQRRPLQRRARAPPGA